MHNDNIPDRVSEIKKEMSILKETIAILGNRIEKLRVQLSCVTRQQEDSQSPPIGAIAGNGPKLSTDLGKEIRGYRDDLDSIISNINNLSSRIEL